METGFEIQQEKDSWTARTSSQQIFDLARTGEIAPETVLRDDQGRIFDAGDYPALAAIFRQRGIDPKKRPPKPPPAPDPDVDKTLSVTLVPPPSSPLVLRRDRVGIVFSLLGLMAFAYFAGAYPRFPFRLWYLAWVTLGALVGRWAYTRGHSYVNAMALSLWLSPIIGFIAVAVNGTNTLELERRQIASGQSRRCPSCAEVIRAQATRCRFCGAEFITSPPSE